LVRISRIVPPLLPMLPAASVDPLGTKTAVSAESLSPCGPAQHYAFGES